MEYLLTKTGSMKKYYAISDSGKVRSRFEIIDTMTGEFVLASKKIISDKDVKRSCYNKTVVLSVEYIDGKAAIKKIGIVKTLNFDIGDYDYEYVKNIFVYLVESYENKKEFRSLNIEQCLVSEV